MTLTERGELNMNFLEKLDFLMEQNGLNKNTLSKACDIPYTTIVGWYKKGYEGLKLTTLRKLSDFFGTSLDFWASEDVNLSTSKPISFNNCLFVGEKDEIELLTDYRFLNHETKNYIRGIVKGLSLSEKIANRHGETITFPAPDNIPEKIIEKFKELGPEYQESILEIVKKMIEEERTK